MAAKQPYTSVWERDAARRRPDSGQHGLSRAQIVRAAIELLDAEGLDALSMRRLGTRLGAGATSIYWHVASKDELLDLVMDEVLGEVAPPGDGAPSGGQEDGSRQEDVHWRELASRYAYGLRQMILRHPWLARLIGTRPGIGPNALRMNNRVIKAFQAAGFRGPDIGFAVSAVSSYTLGTVLPEVAWRNSMTRLNMPEEEWGKTIRAELDRVRAEYPEMVANYDEWMKEDLHVARQVCFDYGLVSMLDGLEARLRR